MESKPKGESRRIGLAGIGIEQIVGADRQMQIAGNVVAHLGIGDVGRLDQVQEIVPTDLYAWSLLTDLRASLP